MDPISQFVADMLQQSDSEIAAALNAASVQKIDSQKWTWSGLSDRFGVELIAGFRTILKATELGHLVSDMLIYPGIDFSLQQTQDQLEAMREVLGDGVDQLKTVGIWNVSPWIDAGRTGSATVDDVATIRAGLTAATAQQVLEAKWATVCNEIVNPAIANGSNWAAIKAAIAEVD